MAELTPSRHRRKADVQFMLVSFLAIFQKSNAYYSSEGPRIRASTRLSFIPRGGEGELREAVTDDDAVLEFGKMEDNHISMGELETEATVEDETESAVEEIDSKTEDINSQSEDEGVDLIEDETEADEPAKKINSMPLIVNVRTNLDSPLIDQTIELTASRNRNIGSLKTSIFRQMRGRPPVLWQKLLLGAKQLHDDEILDDLVSDDEDDDDEEDEDDNHGMATLNLVLDIPPPIDPKFATDFRKSLDKMTTSEIFDSHVLNMVSMDSISRLMKDEMILDLQENHENKDEENDLSSHVSESVTMRKHALVLRESLLSSFPDDVLKILNKSRVDDDNEEGSIHDGDVSLAESIRRKNRTKCKGGAKMIMRRSVQRNLNIQWRNSIRTFLLILFFGHFGAHSPFSRMLILFLAPMSIIIQLRPVKIAIKQLFYAIGKPPGIILSLLPAPEQDIMSVDYHEIMKELYGTDIALEDTESSAKSENELIEEIDKSEEEESEDDESEEEESENGELEKEESENDESEESENDESEEEESENYESEEEVSENDESEEEESEDVESDEDEF